jgi:hypothetical protein
VTRQEQRARVFAQLGHGIRLVSYRCDTAEAIAVRAMARENHQALGLSRNSIGCQREALRFNSHLVITTIISDIVSAMTQGGVMTTMPMTGGIVVAVVP